MKWILALGLFVTASGMAASESVSKAREMCRYLGGSDTVNACLKTLRDAEYVDSTALEVCRYLGGSEKIISCMKAIRDRHYEESELGTCRYLGGSEKVITCLENTGRRERKSVRLERVEEDDEPRVQFSFGSNGGGVAVSGAGRKADGGLRKTLKRALEAVRNGDQARAEALLEAAIDAAR